MKRLKATRYRMPLREYRVAAGLTQEVMAKKLGIRPETYSRIETGAQPLSERMQRLIAFHLRLTPVDEITAFGLPGRGTIGSGHNGNGKVENGNTGLGSTEEAPRLRLVGRAGQVVR